MTINDRQHPLDLLVRAWETTGHKYRFEIWKIGCGEDSGECEVREFMYGVLQHCSGPRSLEKAVQHAELAMAESGRNYVEVGIPVELQAPGD